MMGSRSTTDRLDSSTKDLRLISAVEMRLVDRATAIVAMPSRIIGEPRTRVEKESHVYLQDFDRLNSPNFL